jgi:Phospholipase_D-nuclease N-terminal
MLIASFFGEGFFHTLIFLMLAFFWGFALFDLAKSHASGKSKALWLVVILLVPVVGALAYLITRPSFATEMNPIDNPSFDPREREATALEMTHRSSS